MAGKTIINLAIALAIIYIFICMFSCMAGWSEPMWPFSSTSPPSPYPKYKNGFFVSEYNAIYKMTGFRIASADTISLANNIHSASISTIIASGSGTIGIKVSSGIIAKSINGKIVSKGRSYSETYNTNDGKNHYLLHFYVISTEKKAIRIDITGTGNDAKWVSKNKKYLYAINEIDLIAKGVDHDFGRIRKLKDAKNIAEGYSGLDKSQFKYRDISDRSLLTMGACFY
jgi:hypothetical protein